ncbi:hypothetical protein B0T25DRAFT_602408 [Lasiosphaeria hispida]|uniref:Uncharacterized protein n=1 Tax=Lasiosphaeria hispida TaxID=260671 RepID=A0AAJ0HSW0_9PEZI|nr:hypothetical protein B0T25DRAFT_602408 [Lasiosphaeria hispida]
MRSSSRPVSYPVQALGHRVNSIAALNLALHKRSLTQADSDAKMAAVIIPTFQSNYMGDGMMEFLRMLRGWGVIQSTIVVTVGQSVFRGFTENAYVNSMRTFPKESRDVLAADRRGENLRSALKDFDASLRPVKPQCQGMAELTYLTRADLASYDSTQVRFYAANNDMTSGGFAKFIEQANYAARILLAHFSILSYVLEHHLLGADRSFALRSGILG